MIPSTDRCFSKNQLTQEQSSRNGSYLHTFAYDPAGNPSIFKGVSQSFNADNQNTASGYTYDGDGNPISYKGQTLTFDAENRLIQYGPSSSPLMTAGYDAEGRRAWKLNSSGLLYYLYDGDLPVCDIAGNGVANTFNTFGPYGLISRHFYGGTGLFYAFDPAGNVCERHLLCLLRRRDGTENGNSHIVGIGQSSRRIVTAAVPER